MPPPFWEKPLCRVVTTVINGKRKYPKIEAEDDSLLILFRLSKAGYGSVNEIEEWDTRTVLQALYYEQFCDEYETAYLEINRD